jgi:opacity protein-like surface antigen
MRIRSALLAASLALVAAPALAADDEPVATASNAKGDEGVAGVTARDERKIHGEVSVGVGTGGYRSVYVRSDIPVGETGRVSLAFEDTRNARGYGDYPYGSYGSYGFRGGPLGVVDRQRCDLEGMSAGRPMDVAGGPHGRCVSRVPSW